MTHDPNQPDETTDLPFDADLLDEATRADAAPEELEAKILELTDPRMLSLLDEALAPEAASNELADRIIAATSSPQLADSTARRADNPVLARIGPATFRYAAAAAIALAVGLGIWWSNQDNDNTPGPDDFVINPDETTTDPTAEWNLDEQYATNDAIFDGTTSEIEDVLQVVSDDLETVTIDRDSIWSDMDDYEDFLSDFEVG